MEELWRSIYNSIEKGIVGTLITENRWTLFLDGLWITLAISFFAILLGIFIGFTIAILNLSKFSLLKKIAKGYIDIIRGTPTYTQLLIINFVIFASVNISKITVAAIAFGINSGAYVAEIIRAGILSVDSGQTEAGRSLGLSSIQTMVYIVFPQAIKNILPALGNEFIVLIKETAVAGNIGAADLNKAATTITSRTYNAFWPLIVTAIVYYTVIKIISKLLGMAESRLRKADTR